MKQKREQGETSAEEGMKISNAGMKIPNAGEFLSGFWAGDRLIPSITVTVFFGSEEWDGPLRLFDLLRIYEKCCIN